MRYLRYLALIGLLAKCNLYTFAQTQIGGGVVTGGNITVGTFLPSILNVTLSSITPNQAVLSYSKFATPCTILVSLNPSFIPSIPDVNGAFFPGEQFDSRSTSVVSNGTTYFVLGKRTADIGSGSIAHSRSLTPLTKYYYQVQCGSGHAIGNGNFVTGGLPSGNVYPEPETSFPTVTGTATFNEPQTGITLTPLLYDISWPAGAGSIVCQSSTVISSDSKTGFLCIIPLTSYVFFLDVTDGIARSLGNIPTIFGTYSGDPIDFQVGEISNFYSVPHNTFLMAACTSPDACGSTQPFLPVMLSCAYAGGFQIGDLPTNLTCTNLTPNSTGHNMLQKMQAYISAFDASVFTSWQNIGVFPDGQHFIEEFLPTSVTQGTQVWFGVFDYLGNVTAAIPSWTAGDFMRYAVIHSEGILDGNATGVANSNFVLGPADTRYQAAWQGDQGYNRDGPYKSKVTAGGDLTASPQYLVGDSVPGFGTCPATYTETYGVMTGLKGCDVRTVAGEPCDTTRGSSEPNNCAQSGVAGFYLMDSKVGDRLQVETSPATCGNNVCENLILLGKLAGNNWVLARGAPDYGCLACNNLLQNHTGTTFLGFVAATNFGDQSQAVWNFVTDPNGTGSGVTPWLKFGLSHNTGTSSVTTGQPAFFNCAAGQGTQCIAATSGASLTWVNQPFTATIPQYPTFSGVSTYSIGACGGLSCFESYSSGNPSSPVVSNPNFFMQTDPPEALSNTWAATAYMNVYKVTGVYSGTFNPKKSVLMGSDGGSPMLDVSSTTLASMGPVTPLLTAGRFCLVVVAEECVPGSLTGDIYANSVTSVGNQQETYITVASATNAKLSRFRYDDTLSTTGRQIQPLTGAGRPWDRQTSFWNGRALPDGSSALVFADSVNSGTAGNITNNGHSVVMLANLPPLMTLDAVDRTNYESVMITLPPGPAGTATAYLQFGYSETGLYCTGRAEVCIANGATVGSTPFYFVHESPTSLACTNGCSIAVPAISGRVLYTQAVYFDGLGSQLSTASLPPIGVQ